MSESPAKICSRCRVVRPLDEFAPREGAHDGRRGTCRECVRGYQAKHDKKRRPSAQEPNTRWPNLEAFEDLVAAEVTDTTARLSADVLRRLHELDVANEDIEEMTPAMARQVIRERERDFRQQADRDRRRGSDFEAMKPEDLDNEFATGISNQRSSNTLSKQASAEKRQEFNERMGMFATDFRDAAERAGEVGSIGASIPEEHAGYIRLVAEQERRFGNRRWARSIALAEAHEQLSREAMIYVAETYFKNKVEPTGYARLPRPEVPAKRTACVLLSDLHLGSELDSLDEPVTFKAIEESRRLEWILRQFVEFKPQYRDVTEALVIINGDIIEGLLLHDLRSGAPLTEQKAIFWEYFTRFIAVVAQQYKSVHVVCQPGNHGRDKLRHPGRATSSKWDSHEWSMFFALRKMCSELRNVRWTIPFRAIAIVDVHGSTLGVTHADTELKLGHPDTKAKDNFSELARINSTNRYGAQFDGWTFGHYHTGRFQPGEPGILWNSALVPPNGHARSSGYDNVCGQWIWEATEGHLFGDLRFITVGLAQDRDERLGSLIPPFRFSMFDGATGLAA